MRKVSSRMRSLAVLELINIALIGWFVFLALDAPRTAANLAGYCSTAILVASALANPVRTGRPARAHLWRDLRR